MGCSGTAGDGRRPPTGAGGKCVALSVVLFCACRDPTQITLELTTDTVCSDVDTTSVAAGKPGEVETDEPATVTRQCEPDGRIGSLVLVPSGEDNATIGIRVVTGIRKSAKACLRDGYRALAGELGGCIVARRQLRFVPHTPLKVPITMSLDCLNVPCGATQTCEGAKCVSAEIEDARECAAAEGCELGGTDGGGGEAGVPDAGVDAALDAGVDAALDATMDAGIDAGRDAGGAICEPGNVCTPQYPCIDAVGGDMSYRCRGLFPEWGNVGAVGPYTTTADTVVDEKTGLMWQRIVDSVDRSQSEAMAHCDALVLAGRSDWRLPSITELESIVDDSVADPAIDTTAFPNTPSSAFWTSSPSIDSPGNEWYVHFHYGYSREHTAPPFLDSDGDGSPDSAAVPLTLVRCLR